MQKKPLNLIFIAIIILFPKQSLAIESLANTALIIDLSTNEVLLEKNSKISLLKNQLEKKGYKVKLRNFYSGLNIIQIKNKLFGGSDHRREGIAIGY